MDGNLLTYRNDRLPLTRNHCWDEENRLSAVNDFQTAAAYLYDGSDERVWKLTGNVQQMTINGQYILNFTELNNHTLYTSPYMVINDQGYTKHYYIEGERICSKLGGGFGGVSYHIDEPLDFINDTWDNTAGLDAGKILRDLECTGLGDEFSSINSDFSIINHIKDMAIYEEDYYFYHSDHLGSTSFITDANGEVQQHLQYLPFGELLLEQREHMSRYTPYQFSAKEKDEETGYSYFGARYYMPELSIWSSVDPMSDERSWLSPLNYCQWNPIRFIDPTGMLDDDIYKYNGVEVARIKNDSPDHTYDVLPDGKGGWRVQNERPNTSGVNLSEVEVSEKRSANPAGQGVGEPGFGESLIPVWGSGRSAINAFQNGNYWTGIGYGALAVTDVFLVKAAVTAVAKGTITLAGKYALKQAVANPTLTAREAAAAIRNPALEAMMNGKGVDRAFRAAASNNLILRPAESIGILKISPMNRGADMVGRGILQGTWWDVTTSGSWGAHVTKYGSGGIPLIYP